MSTNGLSALGTPWAGRPERLGVAVLENLVDLVLSGRLAPGETFPSEAELCVHFNLSRTVIREAMRRLEDKGLAEIRQGQGTTVAHPDKWDLLDPVVLDAAIRHDKSRAVLDDLIDVRLALESQMTAEAARRITDAQLAEIGTVLAELGDLLDDPARHSVVDTRFHDLIMRASGNALSRSIVRSIHSHARASSLYNGPMDDWNLTPTHDGHLEIYARLSERDPEGAAQAMEHHILSTWQARRQARIEPR